MLILQYLEMLLVQELTCRCLFKARNPNPPGGTNKTGVRLQLIEGRSLANP